jgi:hypothetical protein
VSSTCFLRAVAANIRFSVGHISFVPICTVYSMTCQCPSMKFHGTTCKHSVENAISS